MKLTAILIFGFLMQVSATGISQTVTLSESNVPLKKVFKEIQKQTGYDFLYTYEVVQNAGKVTVRMKNASLKEALDEVLEGKGLEFKIMEKTVVVKVENRSVVTHPTLDVPLQQQIKVAGKVTDENGNPLEGVSVIVRGTNIGTSSDVMGNFQLEIRYPKSAILEFSRVGYQSTTISLKGRSVIYVSLKVNIAEQEEVVITGFQAIPVEQVTGSYKVIKSDQLENRISSDVISRLEGMIPGLQVDKNLNLTIRGRSTFYGNQKPLVVIDGFPTEDGLDNINPLSIESITVLEDAAAASIYGTRAANGVIVVTTKKATLGSGIKIELSAFQKISQKPDIKDLRLMNSKDYVDLKLQSLMSRNQDPSYFVDYYIDDPYYPTDAVQEIYLRHLLAGNPNLDPSFAYSQQEMESALDSLRSIDGYNQINKYLLRRSILNQFNLSIQNGGERNRFYGSFTYNNDRSMKVGNSTDRFNAYFKNSLQLNRSMNFDISATAIYEKSKNNNPLEGNDWDILDLEGYMPFNSIIDKNGKRVQRPQIGFWELSNKERQGYLPYTTNPLTELDENDNTFSSLKTRLNTGLKIKLIDGLIFNPKFQYERNYSNSEKYFSVNNPRWSRAINTYTLYDRSTGDLTYQLPKGGRLDGSENENVNWTQRTTLEYNKSFHSNRMTLLAGTEASSFSGYGSEFQIIGFDPDALTTTPYDQYAFLNYDVQTWFDYTTGTFYPNLPSKTERHLRELSYFGNGVYSYHGKYNLSTSARLDKASIFGLNKVARNNWLWSVGASWNIDKERFFKSEWINKLKLRATYGINGNRPEPQQTSFLTGSVRVRSYGNPVQEVVLTNPANPNLSSEKVGTLNLGIDYSLLKNRIFGSFDFYRKKSVNLIGPHNLDPTVGWQQAFINYAKAMNTGFTANINAQILQTREFSWQSELNFSYNLNKVIESDLNPTGYLDMLLPFPDGLLIEGKPIGRIYSYRWNGLDSKGEPEIFNEEGKVENWRDAKYGGFNSSLLAYQGTSVPPFYGGFQNTFQFKDFAFGFLFTYKFGYKMRAPVGSRYALYYSPLQVEPEILAKRWRNPGDEAKTNVPAFSGYLNSNQYSYYDFFRSANINVLNASYVRLSNLFINYNLSKVVTRKIGVRELSLKIQAQNLWLWTANNWGVDPDASNDGRLFDEIPSFPKYRTITFGLDIKL